MRNVAISADVFLKALRTKEDLYSEVCKNVWQVHDLRLFLEDEKTRRAL